MINPFLESTISITIVGWKGYLMKKKYKWIFIALITACGVLIVGGLGVKRMERVNEQANLKDNPPVTHENMVRIVKKHRQDIYQAVKADDKYHRIQKITLRYDTVQHNPMGGIMIQGYVNDNKKFDFQVSLEKDNGKIECYENMEDEGLSDFLCRKN